MHLPIDYAELLAAFEKAKADYLVVGGYALALHGAPRYTKDIDIFIGPSASNLARVIDALVEFGAPESTVEAVRSLKGLDVAWMGNPPLRIDLMKEIPGISFEEALSSSVTLQANGQPVRVISREMLVLAKRASGRTQDLADIEKLLP